MAPNKSQDMSQEKGEDREDRYTLPTSLNTREHARVPYIDSPNGEAPLWIAPSAEIWGDVQFAQDVSVWFQSVLRGDVNYIRIGRQTNIQDGTIIHVANQFPCVIGAGVTIGHRATVHACTIEDDVLIGMGAILLTGAIIGQGAVIAAGAVVREHEKVAPFTLMGGVPARVLRKLDPKPTLQDHAGWAQKYVRLAHVYRSQASSR